MSAASGKLGSVVAQLFLAYIDYGHGINYTKIQRWLPYSLLMLVSHFFQSTESNEQHSFSIFMLGGLATTIWWIPGAEHGPDRKVKTLEEWEVGRTINSFSQTWLAKIIAFIWRRIAKTWDGIYLWLDKVSGGDEAERRLELREELRMQVLRSRQSSRAETAE